MATDDGLVVPVLRGAEALELAGITSAGSSWSSALAAPG